MLINTVNGKKIGKGAGKDKKFVICTIAGQKEIPEKPINVTNNIGVEALMNMFGKDDIVEVTDTYIAVKAENGRNPKKARPTSKSKNDEGMIH